MGYWKPTSLTVCLVILSADYYKEDDWTERLHYCLLFNKIDSKFTARYRFEEVKRSWAQRVLKGIDTNSLLFQEAPDLIIKTT